MLFKIIKISAILIVISIGTYCINGGWAENLGALYRNYKEAKLPFALFWRLLTKKH